MFDEFGTFISAVGFPIAVTVYLLVIMKKALDKLTKAIDKMTTVIDKCKGGE